MSNPNSRYIPNGNVLSYGLGNRHKHSLISIVCYSLRLETTQMPTTKHQKNMAVIKRKQKIVSVDEDVEKLEPLCILVGMLNCTVSVENSMAVCPIVKYRITVPSLNSTLRYAAKGIESRDSNRYCLPLFIAALFTVARRWKQPMYPATDEWISTCSMSIQ